jgi:4-nitrophenyl phosphatase
MIKPAAHKEDLDSLRELRGLVIDMDGVLWRGDDAVSGMPEFIQTLRQRNIRFVLATNNNTKTPAEFASKATGLGAPVSTDEVITATTATIEHLKQRYPPGTRLYAVGENAMKDQISQAGYLLADRDVAAVVAALDRGLNYEVLKRATLLIAAGADFIAPNPDMVYPTDEGLVPGSGMVVAALQATTGREPVIIGKPQPLMFEIALKRMGLSAAQCATLGDRLDTDIVGGQRAGLKAILVLSGVTSADDLTTSTIQPDWVFSSVKELTAAMTG